MAFDSQAVQAPGTNSALGEDAIVLERTIDVHIRSLRKKLGEYGETVRGVGYRSRAITFVVDSRLFMHLRSRFSAFHAVRAYFCER